MAKAPTKPTQSQTQTKPLHNFGAPNSTVTTLAIAALVALGISGLVNWSSGRQPKASAPTNAIATGTLPAASTASIAAPTATAPAASAATAGAKWAASATGRIEPRDGELRLVSPLPGRIVDVLVKANDSVSKGDLLVHLDDEDALLKVAAANSEADVRRRERDEEPATGIAQERRKAEDAVAEAERDVFRTRMAFDAATALRRADKIKATDVAAIKVKIASADERVGQARGRLQEVLGKPNIPLPTRLESSLATARTEIAAAESAVEKLRLRAPYDGVALAVPAKVGEYSVPSPDAPLVTFGDLSSLRVRAEVEERDATKVRVGQPIVVRADAFPDAEFTGIVTSVSKTLGSPRMTARGPRRPNDVEVLEVQAALDGSPPLLTGMRVDVYFKLDTTAAAPAATQKK